MKEINLLNGYQIDSIRVFSVFFQISFISIGSECVELWLNTTSVVNVINDKKTEEERDFFSSRIDAISKIYLLIGESVTNAKVDDEGALNIFLGEKSIKIALEDQDIDPSWSITNNSNMNSALFLLRSNAM